MTSAYPYFGPGEPLDLLRPSALYPRAVFRVSAEFFLRCIASMTRLEGNDLVTALIYNAIWAANVRRITLAENGLEYRGLHQPPPDEVLEPVNALSLSQSLHIPYETVRRCVTRLERQGRCVRVGRAGWSIPAETYGRPRTIDEIRNFTPSLLRFLDDLKRSRFDFAPYRKAHAWTVPLAGAREVPANIRALLRVSLKLVMRGVGIFGRLQDYEFTRGIVFATIAALNTRRITNGPDNLVYGAMDRPPPDHLRAPVQVALLARTLGATYETVRRSVAKLVADGHVVRVGGRGLIVPSVRFSSPDGVAMIDLCNRYVDGFIADLHAAGFDFSAY